MSKVFDTQAEAEALMANLMDADKEGKYDNPKYHEGDSNRWFGV